MIASATAEATKNSAPATHLLPRVGSGGVFGEIVDVFPKDFHVFAGVFERLAFRFGHDLVLIAGASTASEFDGE